MLRRRAGPDAKRLNLDLGSAVKRKEYKERPLPNGSRRRHEETVENPCSAASKPIFVTRFSFCTIFRYLQKLHTFFAASKQNVW